MTLRAVTEPAPAVAVEVVVDGAGADLATWSLAEGSAASLTSLAARDDDGAVAATASDTKPGARVTFARAPRGRVTVSYTVDAAADPVRDPVAPMITPTALRVSGESILLLPVAFEDQSVSVVVDVKADALGATGVASSFGLGSPRERAVRGRVLRHAAFLAGQLGTAAFHTQEADDEAAWIGVTAFDPRAAASETAIVRGVVDTFFGGHEDEPEPLLIVGHVRPSRLFSMSRRSRGMLLNVGMQEPWGATGRVAVAHQFVQRWIGGAVWIGPDDAAHEAEAYWFSEGVARFFARDILTRVGLLDPDELLASVATDLAVWHTSPRRGEPTRTAAAHVGDGGMAVLIARGALYALGVDARIRAKSGGKRSLDMVMLAVLEAARDAKRRTLPLSAWIDPVVAELGEGERRVFEDAIVSGQRLALPADALGPCFRQGPVGYAPFDLGFDGKSSGGPSRAIVGLDAKGPAARAGVRPTDRLVSVSYEPGDATTAAKIELDRDGKPLALSYLPAGAVRRGLGFVRRREIPNDRCKR